MPRNKLILFDIDGTLVLTGGAGSRAMTRAFHDAFDVPDGFAGIAMAGRTDQQILVEALARVDLRLEAESMARFQRLYCEYLRQEITAPGPRKGVMPGVRELLGRLHADEAAAVALLTGNFAEAAQIKLDHFDLWRFFPCGAFGDDAVERHDLVPVALRRARACGLPAVAPADVVVVGDTPLDVACARASGARAVAVATGSFDVAALQACGADAVFEDLRDASAFLALLGRR